MSDEELRAEATGWFDRLYADAQRDPGEVPWASQNPCSELAALLSSDIPPGRALVIGCGLGDDAAALAAAGWETTAFDISPTAVEWSSDRHGDVVDWRVADLFDLPDEWREAFDLVVEVRTVQSLPQSLRRQAIEAVASLVGTRLLLVTHLRPHEAIPIGPPWRVSAQELTTLEASGLVREEQRILGEGHLMELVGTWVRPVRS